MCFRDEVSNSDPRLKEEAGTCGEERYQLRQQQVASTMVNGRDGDGSAVWLEERIGS